MIKSLISLLLAAAALPALAQSLPPVDAEVRRVDMAAGKITLKHGAISNLDMPPMTMAFRVKEPALLTQAKTGDRVRVTIDQVNGDYTVMSLEPARP